MAPISYARQADLIKCDMSTPIMVIGAGGIGSFTVLTLAKMGFTNITVFDFDKVESHNLPNQFYRIKDIGQYKVEALADIVMEYTGTELVTCGTRFEARDLELYQPKVLISAVDNMDTRKQLFEAYMKDCMLEYFLDGRMGADQAEVYLVGETGEQVYRDVLWPEGETAQLPCTSKATMYNVLTIASIIANQVRLALMGEATRPAIIVDNKNLSMHYVQ